MGGKGMLVIQTSLVDLYTRLWCVHEVDRALEMKVPIDVAMSGRCLEDLERRAKLFLDNKDLGGAWLDGTNINVDTRRATCGCKGDEAMLMEKIYEHGGFDRLNTAIARFRKEHIPLEVIKMGLDNDYQYAKSYIPDRFWDHETIIKITMMHELSCC